MILAKTKILLLLFPVISNVFCVRQNIHLVKYDPGLIGSSPRYNIGLPPKRNKEFQYGIRTWSPNTHIGTRQFQLLKVMGWSWDFSVSPSPN